MFIVDILNILYYTDVCYSIKLHYNITTNCYSLLLSLSSDIEQKIRLYKYIVTNIISTEK